MISVPSGVRVWLAVGRTDMRRGMNGLALQIQEALRRDPHAGGACAFDLIWHSRPKPGPITRHQARRAPRRRRHLERRSCPSQFRQRDYVDRSFVRFTGQDTFSIRRPTWKLDARPRAVVVLKQ